MFLTTPVLAFPLKAIRWPVEEIYKKNPETRLEAEKAIKVFYDENKDDLERRGVTDALVKSVHKSCSLIHLYIRLT